MTSTTAEVQVLTAEVRVLMVGSRQVTLSVYRQLDPVAASDIEPFGRVSDDRSAKLPWPRSWLYLPNAGVRRHDGEYLVYEHGYDDRIEVDQRRKLYAVGRDHDGVLVRSRLESPVRDTVSLRPRSAGRPGLTTRPRQPTGGRNGPTKATRTSPAYASSNMHTAPGPKRGMTTFSPAPRSSPSSSVGSSCPSSSSPASDDHHRPG